MVAACKLSARTRVHVYYDIRLPSKASASVPRVRTPASSYMHNLSDKEYYTWAWVKSLNPISSFRATCLAEYRYSIMASKHISQTSNQHKTQLKVNLTLAEKVVFLHMVVCACFCVLEIGCSAMKYRPVRIRQPTDQWNHLHRTSARREGS